MLPDNDSTTPMRRGAIAVAIRDGRVLVIRRSQTVIAPGAYCFPGGGIEPGETEEAALHREMIEELGTPVRPLHRLWRSVTPWNVALVWWLVELDANAVLTPNPDEVESVHSMTFDEMRNHPEMLPTNRDFLDALIAGETEGPMIEFQRSLGE